MLARAMYKAQLLCARYEQGTRWRVSPGSRTNCTSPWLAGYSSDRNTIAARPSIMPINWEGLAFS
jgi:hypothetical protein